MELFKKHKCLFEINLYNIKTNENTASLIRQCKCGKTNHINANINSEVYKEFIKRV